MSGHQASASERAGTEDTVSADSDSLLLDLGCSKVPPYSTAERSWRLREKIGDITTGVRPMEKFLATTHVSSHHAVQRQSAD